MARNFPEHAVLKALPFFLEASPGVPGLQAGGKVVYWRPGLAALRRVGSLLIFMSWTNRCRKLQV